MPEDLNDDEVADDQDGDTASTDADQEPDEDTDDSQSDTDEDEGTEEDEEADSEEEQGQEEGEGEDRSVEDVVQQERQEKVVNELRELRKVPFGPERDERWEAVQEYLREGEALATTMTAPGVTAAERVDAWDSADERTREIAQQNFAVTAPFDIDLDSEMYATEVETQKNQAAGDARWVAEQRANRRSS